MKKILLFFLLLCPVAGTFSQSKFQPTTNILQTGIDFRTNTPLTGREMGFGMPVFRIHPLPDESFALMLRQKKPNKAMWTFKGEVMVYNPASGQMKWQKKFKYAESQLLLDSDVILEQRGNKLKRLNPENGLPLWKTKGIAYKVFPEANRAFCYDVQGDGGYKVMRGIDLENGRQVWQRYVPGAFGWQDQQMLNDETALIKSSGLHVVRVTDGDGWSVDRVSHAEKVDMKQVGLAVLTVAVATAGTAFTGSPYYAVPISGNGYTNIFLNICSNVVFEKDTVFFAAKNKISRHSLDGRTIWTTELNEKQTSKSHLFKEGNVLYMINTGHAIKNGQAARFGTPFIAAFDATTGRQLFMKVWGERKNYFTDYMIQGRDLYLLYRDKLEVHEFSPEGLTQKDMMTMHTGDEMQSFVSDELFAKKDSACLQLSLDRDHYYIHSEAGDLLKFNNDFLLVEKVDKAILYRNYFENADFRFLGNEKETFVVNKTDNLPVAHCEIPHNASRFGTRFYYRKSNLNIAEMDMRPFMSTFGGAVGRQND